LPSHSIARRPLKKAATNSRAAAFEPVTMRASIDIRARFL
jgi:hypothetical protein